MSSALGGYYEALERLKKNKPKAVPRGTKITNDSVSMEAGRGKGAIKKSRAIFRELIEAIRVSGEAQSEPTNDLKNRLEKKKSEAKKYRRLYEESLGRELSLLYELEELKKEMGSIQKKKLVRIK